MLIAAVSLVTVGVATRTAAHAASAPLVSIRDGVGAYRLPDRAIVAVFEQDAEFRFVNYSSGELRRLDRASANVFVGGPGVEVGSPVGLRIELGPIQAGKALWITVDGQRANRVRLVSRPAQSTTEGVRLQGRLLTLPNARHRAAVVVVPAARGTNELWAIFFATQGLAVVTYDRRGVRRSGGTYDHAASDANIRTLASDAVSWVNWLAKQPEADPRRIGLAGGSQAGWVVALAASESPLVRFAAMQSAPAMSAGRQAAYAALTGFGRRDPTDEQIVQALQTVPDSGFDPHLALSSLTIPVLWQLGALDKRMYTPESVADLATINSQGAGPFTVQVYPGGAHSLRLTDHGLLAEEQTSAGFIPDVFKDLSAWLAANTHP